MEIEKESTAVVKGKDNAPTCVYGLEFKVSKKGNNSVIILV